MKQILIQGVPDHLHGSFKAACARRHMSMKETLIAFMEKFSKHENRKFSKHENRKYFGKFAKPN